MKESLRKDLFLNHNFRTQWGNTFNRRHISYQSHQRRRIPFTPVPLPESKYSTTQIDQTKVELPIKRPLKTTPVLSD